MNSGQLNNDLFKADPNDFGSTRTFADANSDPTKPTLVRRGAAEPIPAQISRFRILRLLGQGAFGSVYLAHDPILDRDIALKVPRQGATWSEEQLQSFLHEARTAARLKSPHAVTVYEAGICDDAGVFIAMEYIDGESLSDRLRRGKLSVDLAVRVCAQIADAVHQAHRIGLVHRDLKPSNVLIDRAGNAHVCDFGLALLEDKQTRCRGEVSGTLPYMAPEQVRGEAHMLDGRADVWSLGVILYECLAGRRPFRGGSWAELEENILSRDPKPLRQIDEALPKSLDRLCQRCLERDLTQRLRSAVDFREALTANASTKRRRKRFTAVMICLFLAASGGTGVIYLTYSAPAAMVVQLDSLTDRDLLAQPPKPVLFDPSNPNENYFYHPDMRRLVIAAPYWSLFECGEYPPSMKLDITAMTAEPRGTAGVFWGLHPVQDRKGSTRLTCLLVVAGPHELRPTETMARCYCFRMDPKSASITTDNLGEARLDIDRSAPLRLQVDVSWGELRGLRVAGKRVQLPVNADVDWKTFAHGKCGLVAVKRQVSFTRAFLTAED